MNYIHLFHSNVSLPENKKEGFTSVRISPLEKISPDNTSPYEQMYIEQQYNIPNYLPRKKTGISIITPQSKRNERKDVHGNINWAAEKKVDPHGDINWAAEKKVDPHGDINWAAEKKVDPHGDINWATEKENFNELTVQPSPEKNATAEPMN